MRNKRKCTAAQRCLTAAGCKERNECGGGKMIADTKCGVVFFFLTSHGYFTWKFSERTGAEPTHHNNYGRNFNHSYKPKGSDCFPLFINKLKQDVIYLSIVPRNTQGISFTFALYRKKKQLFDRFSLPRRNHHSSA